MKIKSKMIKNTIIMTAVNLIMRSAGVYFNSYLTSRIGTGGIGLFQLVMSVYSMAVTFSTAGIRLAVTRATVEIIAKQRYDLKKSVAFCMTYAGMCGTFIGLLLLMLSNLIGINLINNPETVLPLKILSFSLPFVAMSSALGGLFTAVGKIPQYSAVQMLEQAFKISVIVYMFSRSRNTDVFNSCIIIVFGMTASEIFSFTLSSLLSRKLTRKSDEKKSVINPLSFFRVALPDSVGTCVRSVLLTAEHLLIPKSLNKNSNVNALSVYGLIHGLIMPILLYPSAVLTSFSGLIIPELARKSELDDRNGINETVEKNLKRTFIFSLICSFIFWIFSDNFATVFCKNKEAAMYIKILSPLVPIMYTDTVTDGMLKGLDQQVYSMRYNIIDSAVCVLLVIFVLPKYSVKGYIMILYVSELLNFFLSMNRLTTVCEIRFFRAHGEDNSTFFRLKKYLNAHRVCGYHTYRVRTKRSQGPLSFRRTIRIQDLHELR